MDYNDFELLAFWVLAFAAAPALTAIGILVHVRGGAKAPGLYLVLGITASIVYGIFAGVAVGIMFRPPYVPGLSGGRGLDLRGITLVMGSWIGGALGVLATVLASAISRLMHWNRKRKTTGTLGVQAPKSIPD
jgi:hypothetical protein